MMKIGICSSSFSRVADFRRMGWEFAEVHAGALAKRGEAEYRALADMGQTDLLCANCLIPGDLRLTGADVDFDRIRAYSEGVFARLDGIGVRTVVFGSGQAKQVPEGFPRETAWEQLYRVAELFSDEAAKYGQTVVIEALNDTEVNIVNTVEEAADYVRHVNRPNVRLLADFYHMYRNGEDLSVIRKYAPLFRHFHIAAPADRGVLTENDRGYIRQCFSVLKEIGYEGTVSFEGFMDPELTGVEEMLRILKSEAE